MVNVIDISTRAPAFPRLATASPWEKIAATVYDIVKPQGTFHLYRERFTAKDAAAGEFFAVLPDVKSISIVNKDDSMTRESILRIEKIPGCRYELRLDTFIRLTELVPGMVSDENMDRYVTSTLDAADLQVGMICKDEDTFTDSVMNAKWIRTFKLNERPILFKNGYYACTISSVGGKGRSFSLDDFKNQGDGSPDDTLTLLTLFCHAYEAYFGNGCIVDDEDIKIELTKYVWKHTHTTLVPFGLFQGLILSAITRKYPIYNNYPSDKRIKRFHEDTVYKLLSKEYMEGEFDEEE